MELTDDTDSSISATDKVKRTGVERSTSWSRRRHRRTTASRSLPTCWARPSSPPFPRAHCPAREAVEKWFFSDDRKEGDF